MSFDKNGRCLSCGHLSTKIEEQNFYQKYITRNHTKKCDCFLCVGYIKNEMP